MSRYCPIVDHKVTYQFCEDCDDHKCENKDKNENRESVSADTSFLGKRTQNRRGEFL